MRENRRSGVAVKDTEEEIGECEEANLQLGAKSEEVAGLKEYLKMVNFLVGIGIFF